MQRILNELREGFKPILPRIIREIEEIRHLPSFEIEAAEAEDEGVSPPDFGKQDVEFLAQLLDDTPEVKEEKRRAAMIVKHTLERERGMETLQLQMDDYRNAKPLLKKTEDIIPEPIPLNESKAFFSQLKNTSSDT